MLFGTRSFTSATLLSRDEDEKNRFETAPITYKVEVLEAICLASAIDVVKRVLLHSC